MTFERRDTEIDGYSPLLLQLTNTLSVICR